MVIEIKSFDRAVGMGASRPVAVHDLSPVLIGGNPGVGVAELRDVLGKRPVKDVPKVAELCNRQVLD